MTSKYFLFIVGFLIAGLVVGCTFVEKSVGRQLEDCDDGLYLQELSKFYDSMEGKKLRSHVSKCASIGHKLSTWHALSLDLGLIASRGSSIWSRNEQVEKRAITYLDFLIRKNYSFVFSIIDSLIQADGKNEYNLSKSFRENSVYGCMLNGSFHNSMEMSDEQRSNAVGEYISCSMLKGSGRTPLSATYLAG